MTRESLVAAARDARAVAYAPYSRFAVGAALLCRDGSIYQGCNVENASFGLTICAERNAIFSAIAQGKRDFVALAVVGGEEAVVPCGACLQVMSEFAPALVLYLAAAEGNTIIETTLPALLPAQFTLSKEETR